ncbi:MAG: glycerophosphodiester phosphodiesterase family protein [Bdellovibrionota bacterium]
MTHLFFTLAFLIVFDGARAQPRKLEIQGHRGARSVRPENTLSAFKYALENKIEVLEMDLQYTKDHVLVLGHDEKLNPNICLDPMGNKIKADSISVNSLTLAELQKYDCGSLINPRFPKQIPSPKEKMPTFAEVLALVNNYEKSQGMKYKLNVEIKVPNEYVKANTPRMVKELIEAVKKHKIYDRTVLQSFDIEVLDVARAKDPKLQTSFLIEEKMDVILAKLNLKTTSDLIRKYKFNILSPNFKLMTKVQVKDLQSQGIQVIPWTANDPQDWKSLLDMEVDGIITDDPVALKSFLN